MEAPLVVDSVDVKDFSLVVVSVELSDGMTAVGSVLYLVA